MVDDFSGPRAYRGTPPFDPNDPPRFGQLIETAKDAIASELRRFFDYASDDIRAKIGEYPAIEKFGITASGSTSESMETTMNLIMSFGDVKNKYPMIAITSANMREKQLGLGDTIACEVQQPPRVVATESGPFTLEDGWELQVRTWPQGLDNDPVDSTILFADVLFSDISNATVDDVIKAINAQVLYTQAAANGSNFLQIVAGGPAAHGTPNAVEIIGGDAACLLALGYKVGQVSRYTDSTRLPARRHAVAGDATINIDVVSDDLNTRTALADLVWDFFTFYMSRHFFQILGRSYDDPDLTPPEWYQIILKREFAWAGEYNVPRAGGDQLAHIHSVRGSVPLTIVDFIDRQVTEGFMESRTLAQSEDLPQGDYFGVNYIKLG